MKKIIAIIILLILMGILLFYVISKKYELNFAGYNIKEIVYKKSFTKAICDKNNYCQDYEIVCENEKVVSMNPTGAIVQFHDEWQDPRDNETREKLCND